MRFKQDELEMRCLPTSEVRLTDSGSSPKITGYAAVFNTWADIGGWFRESIKPGAFSQTIKDADIHALWNHDVNYVLGRNKAGTLRLREDSKGLAIEIDPVDASWSDDLMKSMKRGDVNQMSFGFGVNKQDINYDRDERILEDVTLFDVSIVTKPAYPTTTAQVRSLFHKEQEVRSWTELDNVITKIKAGEELTEDELRVLMAYAPQDKELNPRELENALRDAGCSRKQAKEILAKGLIIPDERDAPLEEEDPLRDAEPATEDKSKVSELLIRAELVAPSL